jgi:hypothetical protein
VTGIRRACPAARAGLRPGRRHRRTTTGHPCPTCPRARACPPGACPGRDARHRAGRADPAGRGREAVRSDRAVPVTSPASAPVRWCRRLANPTRVAPAVVRAARSAGPAAAPTCVSQAEVLLAGPAAPPRTARQAVLMPAQAGPRGPVATTVEPGVPEAAPCRWASVTTRVRARAGSRRVRPGRSPGPGPGAARRAEQEEPRPVVVDPPGRSGRTLRSCRWSPAATRAAGLTLAAAGCPRRRWPGLPTGRSDQSRPRRGRPADHADERDGGGPCRRHRPSWGGLHRLGSSVET